MISSQKMRPITSFKNYGNFLGSRGTLFTLTELTCQSAEFSGKRYFQQYGPVVDFVNNKVEDKFTPFPEYADKVVQWIREVLSPINVFCLCQIENKGIE